MPAIDTLKLKTRLSESGMLEPQAQALVEELDEALSKAINQEIATKADIAELQGTLKADIAELQGATKADIAELQGTVQSFNERLRGLMAILEQHLNGRIDNLEARFEGETNLLRWMVTATLIIVVAIGVRLLFM